MTSKRFKFIDLFAGIGGMRIPFESFKGQCVFSSEIDSNCQDAYEANFGERPHGDIVKIDPADIPNHDILLGGFPCQSFSIIGQQKGFSDTRGTLFFEIEKILEKKKPRAFLLENVKQLFTHDKGNTYRTIHKKLTDLGYNVHTDILNSLDFGVPQKRERTYIVGFMDHNIEFTFPKHKKPHNMASILEDDSKIPERYFASDYIVNKRLKSLKTTPPTPSVWHENKSGNISPLPYSCALRANASYNYLLVNGRRRFTEREMLRLQGFPENYKIVCNYSQTRKQAGNSVTVPTIKAIAQNMLEAMGVKKDRKCQTISKISVTLPDVQAKPLTASAISQYVS